MPTTAPFGSWPSPLTADLIVQASVSLGGPAIVGDEIWWSELRPSEGGRVQLVRKPLNGPGSARDVLPDGYSARTRVHEYGGGAWWLHGTTVFFTNWTDQRLYRLDDDGSPPVAITADAPQPGSWRYADGQVTADGRWVICVREWHGAPAAREPRNQLVALASDGSTDAVVLVGGDDDPEPADFVSSPRISPDGSKLRWLQWHHPDMPWDATEVGVGRLVFGPGGPRLIDPHGDGRARGRVSVAQPVWSPAGAPYSVRDDDGWWRIWFDGFDPGPITPGQVEWAQPQWVFGQSWYAFTNDGRGIVAAFKSEGRDRLAWIPSTGTFDGDESTVAWGEPVILDVPYTAFDGVTAGPRGTVACIASSFTTEPEIITIDTAAIEGATVPVAVQRPARDVGVDPAWWSEPDHITFPTTDEATAYGLYYPPRNPEVAGPPGTFPPLVVMIHGGPTAAARSQLSLGVQYWTTRGFGVVDVNYRGSTGYGRAFREALNGAWGIADVDDCIAAARWLAEGGRVDGSRLVIRGGSAGGYTVLRALTLSTDFAAGCSLYGIADLEALAADTHKFESRYTDRLVGPYPEAKTLYAERSPIHHVEDLATPLLILQGLEDEVVPPAQAEMMVDALRAKRIPFAYIPFAGEEHGFRQAATIKRALEAELYFYGRVLGFEPADAIEPVPVEFL